MNSQDAAARLALFFRVCMLCGTVAMTLSACVPTMLVGGGVAGTVAATDRRTFGTQTEDRTIGFKGESLADAIVGGQGHVSVTSFNRIALVTGEVPNEGMKTRVASEIAQIPNVRNVVNALEIAPPASFGSRSDDSMITAKVAASFVDTQGLYANSLKTVTERGVVYLMGRVTQREGDLAAGVASGVPGVQRVVKVFEYISEEELAGMKAREAATDTTNQADSFEDSEVYR